MRRMAVVTTLGLLVAGATAAIALRPVVIYTHAPDRPHVVLGEVAVASTERPPEATWSVHHAGPLVAETRAVFGREAHALIGLRHETLPNGTATRSVATAVRWTNFTR
jgi:hypothetical protein